MSYPVRPHGFLINCKVVVTIVNVKICFNVNIHCKIKALGYIRINPYIAYIEISII